MKRSIILAVVAILVSAAYGQSEEIKLATIIPDQQVVRGKDAAIGSTYKSKTDAQVPDGDLIVEGNVGIGTTLIVEGNVGIGTTAPEYKLEVDGGMHLGPKCSITLHREMEIVQLGAPSIGLVNAQTGKKMSMVWDSRVSPNEPDKLLFFHDTNEQFGGGATTFIFDLENGIGASWHGWVLASSKRWKTNIEPITGALEKVKRLKGVSFDWKADGKHDIGMIAEEVGEVIPEVVAYEENGTDAKSLDYARLVAVLVEAIKEQQAEIEELKGEVAALRN